MKERVFLGLALFLLGLIFIANFNRLYPRTKLEIVQEQFKSLQALPHKSLQLMQTKDLAIFLLGHQ
ncbi:hypothetical protein [Streptococcus oricebi]|uniref:Uncharacterized protein n=1 Tax=Streptococcus oricebi TaxID=1547447 RepID=A0ABS5B4E6_9STRE|nr:hypothetical protein [Streptococcus oricebi]MBP2623701.1 hypothetical protein [Streptococcus oricebi]